MSAESGVAIRDVHDLGRSYGRGTHRFDALKGVSLRVAPGDSVAIVGRSGSGNSTLIHLLALLDRPDHGTLRVGGVDAATLSSRQLSRRFELLPVASILLTVMLIAFLAGTLPARRAARHNPIDALRYE